jgi:hypothetical protein
LQSDNKALGYLDSCGQGIEYDHYNNNNYYYYLVNDDQGQNKGGGSSFSFCFLFPLCHVITKALGSLGEHQWNKFGSTSLSKSITFMGTTNKLNYSI